MNNHHIQGSRLSLLSFHLATMPHKPLASTIEM